MIKYDEQGNPIGLDESKFQHILNPQPTKTKGQPQPSAPEAHQPKEDPGFWDYAADVPQGVWNGVVDAGKELYQFGYDALDLVADFDNKTAPGVGFLNSIKADLDTGLGAVVEDITNFGVGMVGAGKFLKPIKILQGAGKASFVARGAAEGAIADFAFMNPLENTVAEMMQDSFLANPVAEALASEEGDSKWEMRFKNALEGMALGIPIDAALATIKGVRAARRGDKAALKEAIGQVDEAVAGGVSSKVPAEGVSVTAKQTAAESVEQAVIKGSAEAPADAVSIVVKATQPEARALDLFKAIKAESNNFTEFQLRKNQAVREGAFKFDSEQDFEVLRRFSEIAFEDTQKALKGSKTMQELVGDGIRGLEDMGIDGTTLRQQIANVSGSTKDVEKAIKEMYVLQDMLATFTTRYKFLGDGLVDGVWRGDAADKAMKEFVSLENGMLQSMVTMSDHKRSVGQALVALKEASSPVKDAKITLSLMQQRLKKAGFKDITRPEVLLRHAKIDKTRSGLEYGTELFINNILSGPLTHLINTSSNAAKVILTPLYRVSSSIKHGNLASMADDLRAYRYLTKAVPDALAFAFKALKEDRTILDGMQSVGWTDGALPPVQKAWSKENVLARYYSKQMRNGVPADRVMDNIPWHVELTAGLVNNIGKVITFPTRVLQAEDEFFKQLVYRSELMADITAEGLTQMPGASSKALGEYVASQMPKAFDMAGGGTRNDLLQTARTATFTQDLTGKMGKSIQDFSNSHPAIKFILPFVRTPANLLLEARDHLPFVAKHTQRYKEAMAQGGRAAREAEGKITMGTLFMASAFFAAQQGKITGAPPQDKTLRQAQERSGWQPYSIKIGENYYSYARLDPLGMLLGAAANLAEGVHWLSEDDASKAFSAGVMNTVRMFEEKSYMQGLSNFVGLFSEDPQAINTVHRSLVTGMVPWSSMLRTIRSQTDELQRDVRSTEAYIRNIIPGLSDTLPAKYDWLTGKPVLQTMNMISPINEDVVARELVMLGGVTQAPTYNIGSVKLSESQHSRYCELIGTTKIGGKTLHQALNTIIRSPAYDQKRQNNTDDDGGRKARLQKTINQYRQAAQKQLFKEDTALKSDKVLQQRIKKAAKTPNGVERWGAPEAPRSPDQQRILDEFRGFIK